MFCPKCGLKQIDEEASFCRSCGFALDDVAEALRNDGEVSREVSNAARRPKGLGAGLAVMSVTAIIMFLTIVLFTHEPSGAVQFNFLLGFIVFLFALAFTVYSGWFRDRGGPETSQRKVRNLKSNAAANRLAQGDPGEPVNAYVAPITRATTSELVQPDSVTSGTTKLLSKEMDQSN